MRRRQGDARSLRARLAFGVCVCALAALPLAVFCLPVDAALDRGRPVWAGKIQTEGKPTVNVWLLVGDVFNPRNTSADLGFDVVAVSCYFDPVVTPDATVLPANPLLLSALRASAAREKDMQDFSRGLLNTLGQSSDYVRCLLGHHADPCVGDRIWPYSWPVSLDSPMREHGVASITAIPLFNPQALTGRLSPGTVREALAANLSSGVIRLLGEDRVIHSVAFAALGSTSHRTDSNLFLEFTEGYLTILSAVEHSHPPSSLDRVYLVAFDKLSGAGREDAVRGLEVAAAYLRMKRVFGTYEPITLAIFAALWFGAAVAARPVSAPASSSRLPEVADWVSLLGVLLFNVMIVHSACSEIALGRINVVVLMNAVFVAAGAAFLWWSTGSRRRRREPTPPIQEQLMDLPSRGAPGAYE